MNMNIDFKKEKARVYQREYYKKNRQYHVLYHLRKRLISNINYEIKNTYAKLNPVGNTLVCPN